VLPGLNDGEVHTVAAEFDANGEQRIAAQRFRVDLPARSGGTGSASSSSPASTPAETPLEPEREPQPDQDDDPDERSGAGASDTGSSLPGATESANGTNGMNATNAANGTAAGGSNGPGANSVT
jgi:hypothetical protein